MRLCIGVCLAGVLACSSSDDVFSPLDASSEGPADTSASDDGALDGPDEAADVDVADTAADAGDEAPWMDAGGGADGVLDVTEPPPDAPPPDVTPDLPPDNPVDKKPDLPPDLPPDVMMCPGIDPDDEDALGSWTQLSPCRRPSTWPHSAAKLAYDGATGLVTAVTHGEQWLDPENVWTWSAVDRAWDRYTPCDGEPWPKLNNDFAVAFDGGRGVVAVLFFTPAVHYWEWNGKSKSFAKRTLAGGVLPSFTSAAVSIAYDQARKRIVVIGRHNEAPYATDTWELNPTDASFVDRTPVDTAASLPSLPSSLIYDAKAGKVVWLGWNSASSRQEMRAWNGSSGAWELTWASDTGGGPGSSDHPTLTFDAGRGHVLSYDNLSYQVWEWDGSTWTSRSPASLPDDWPRTGGGWIYDVSRSRAVLVATYPIGEAWEWNGDNGTWVDQSTLPGEQGWPEVRAGAAFAYDPDRERVVMFGGHRESYRLYDELWDWDPAANVWTNRTPFERPALWPKARSMARLSYDADRKRFVMFGGDVGDGSGVGGGANDQLWELDAASGTWATRGTTPRPPAWPPVRSAAGQVWDPDRHRTVVFGGAWSATFWNDVWEWDGAAGEWTLRPASGAEPDPRREMGMVYDTARKRVVVIGGVKPLSSGPRPLDDVWEWDGAGATWTQRPCLTTTELRGGFQAVFDPGRKVIWFLSGRWGATEDDLWRWDPVGGSFTRSTAASPAPSRIRRALTFDPTMGRVIVFGGDADNIILDDLWGFAPTP